MFLFVFQIQHDLQFIKEDILAVERRRIELYRRRERYSAKLRMLFDEPSSNPQYPYSIDKPNAALYRTGVTPGQCCVSSGGSLNRKSDLISSGSHLLYKKDAHSGSESQNPTHSGLALARKRRVHAQVSDL